MSTWQGERGSNQRNIDALIAESVCTVLVLDAGALGVLAPRRREQHGDEGVTTND